MAEVDTGEVLLNGLVHEVQLFVHSLEKTVAQDLI